MSYFKLVKFVPLELCACFFLFFCLFVFLIYLRLLTSIDKQQNRSYGMLFHWINMYPMTLMRLSPLSAAASASMPHVLVLSCPPPEPNPILESQLWQLSSLLPTIPILVFEEVCESHFTLNPSLLQLFCKEPWEPSRLFHVSRPTDMGRNCPSAISEYKELDCLLMTMNLIWWPILIPRQIFEKCVFQ